MWDEISRSNENSGYELILYKRDKDFMIRSNGLELMTTLAFHTEERIADLAFSGRDRHKPCHVLIGGLGFGYTLRRTLKLISGDSNVVVCEISQDLIRWTHGPLSGLMSDVMGDNRTRVLHQDVMASIQDNSDAFDVIILDVDNGPSAITMTTNKFLYAKPGLTSMHQSLKKGGSLAVWSSYTSPEFENELRRAGFAVDIHEIKISDATHHRHTIYIGKK